MSRSTPLPRATLRRREPAPASLVQAIAATAELCGHTISTAAAELLATDVAGVSVPAVLAALARCRLELHGPLTLGEILARIDDGRPPAEQAWHMLPASEAASVVWTSEMAQVWGAIAGLLQEGKPDSAYAAFRDAYTQAVLIARCKREPVRWSASLGTDLMQREQVLREALKAERLPASYVESLLPYRSLSPQAQQLLTQVRLKALQGKF